MHAYVYSMHGNRAHTELSTGHAWPGSKTAEVREASGGRLWDRGGGGDGLVLLATCPFLTHDIASDFTT